MRKVIQYSLLLSLFVGFMSCNNQQANNIDDKENASRDKYLELQDNFEYVNRIPDSIQTPEQKALSRLLMRTFLENTEVDNKRFVFKLTRNEVVALGLPAPYYEVLANNSTDFNTAMDRYAQDSTISNLYKEWDRLKHEALYTLDSLESVK